MEARLRQPATAWSSRSRADPGTRARMAHLPSSVGEVRRNASVTTQFRSPLLPAAGDLAPALPERWLAGLLAPPPRNPTPVPHRWGDGSR